MTHPLTIATGHSIRIVGVHLVAIIEEDARTLRIEQHGEHAAEHDVAVKIAGRLLLERMQRVRPDLREQR